jgi:hypothetical protein
MRLVQVARIYIWETLMIANTRCSSLKVLTGLCMTSLTDCFISRRCHYVGSHLSTCAVCFTTNGITTTNAANTTKRQQHQQQQQQQQQEQQQQQQQQ